MREPREIAEAVRRACLEALLEAHERAGTSGLCAEGRWEAAVAALRDLDLDQIAGEAMPIAAPPAANDSDLP